MESLEDFQIPIHHFTLTIEGPDLQDDVLIDLLFEVGCDDALVSQSNGVQYLDFDRAEESLGHAILSVIADVERLNSVMVVRIDNVGLIAK